MHEQAHPYPLDSGSITQMVLDLPLTLPACPPWFDWFSEYEQLTKH